MHIAPPSELQDVSILFICRSVHVHHYKGRKGGNELEKRGKGDEKARFTRWRNRPVLSLEIQADG